MTKPTQHAWSTEALFNKALLYVEEMEDYTVDEWQFGLWSSLALEFIARAALSNISPTLLADGKNWRNTYHALGHPPTRTKFVPISINTAVVFSMLQELLPDFTEELATSCMMHCSRRNAELHTGEEAFAKLGTSEWLAKFYASCEVLLQSMGMTLEDLFDDPKSAQEMVASLQDRAAMAVKKDIALYEELWKQKTPEERLEAAAQAAAWATRQAGHRANCPACASNGLIRGSGQGPVSTEIEEDIVIQKQTMLPSTFECVACGLKIAGWSKLAAAGLGDAFTSTLTQSPAEFFDLYTSEEMQEARAYGEPADSGDEYDFNE
jgi:hypothetical protein